jgi:hypothetical protein
MKKEQVFPQIINVTDLRYRWSDVEKQLEENEQPILVLEHSTPKAVLYPFNQDQNVSKGEDPLVEWRKKYADQFSGWDATAVIRKSRDSRWNLS